MIDLSALVVDDPRSLLAFSPFASPSLPPISTGRPAIRPAPPPPARFRSRTEAGRLLAQRLRGELDRRTCVLATPTAVPIGEAVAAALAAPLEVVVGQHLGTARHPHFSFGAVAEGGGVYVNPHLARLCGASAAQVETAIRSARVGVDRVVETYRGGRPLPDVAGSTVVLVDEGIVATTMIRALVRSIRGLGPNRLVVAASVVAAEHVHSLASEADAVVGALTPTFPASTWSFYDDFRVPTDDEILASLTRTRARAMA